jgi:phosphoribosylaminoimidazole (AIR) synthetase
VVARPERAEAVSAQLTAAGEEVFEIGEIVAGERGVELA